MFLKELKECLLKNSKAYYSSETFFNPDNKGYIKANKTTPACLSNTLSVKQPINVSPINIKKSGCEFFNKKGCIIKNSKIKNPKIPTSAQVCINWL